MTGFDAEKFEDKYVHYFPELQRAYKAAFTVMNDTYDSTLIHAIDQQVLNESEPFYEPETDSFRIELPDDPFDRTQGVVADRQQFDDVLERYCAELRAALEAELLP